MGPERQRKERREKGRERRKGERQKKGIEGGERKDSFLSSLGAGRKGRNPLSAIDVW